RPCSGLLRPPVIPSGIRPDRREPTQGSHRRPGRARSLSAGPHPAGPRPAWAAPRRPRQRIGAAPRDSRAVGGAWLLSEVRAPVAEPVVIGPARNVSHNSQRALSSILTGGPPAPLAPIKGRPVPSWAAADAPTARGRL